MPNYRRYYVPGGTYFFTCVTFERRPLLTTSLARECLRKAIGTVQNTYPFEIVAIVLLPDHWHTVWSLPAGDERYPLRWRRIKEEFTKAWLDRGGTELRQSVSRQRHRQRGVWHKRYWEHLIESEDELKRCCDYVHWNPRKHNLVASVQEWRWSSFRRFVGAGEYEIGWGATDPTPDWDAPEMGDVL